MRMGDDVCGGPSLVGGMGVTEGMANDSSRDFSSSLVDECRMSIDLRSAFGKTWKIRMSYETFFGVCG